MKTITFYSYKGGVGRSLALANIATRLAEFKKKVCLIDFDLEAPGLQFKFDGFANNNIKSGIVDYIADFNETGSLPSSIKQYCISFNIDNNKNSIDLIPAGNVESKSYWKKLSSINWNSLLYSNETGIAFFLDLKEKIEKELKPDFLLIDSRTGISEMSGITLSLFADEIVIVAANNKENLLGCKKIIKTLSDPENLILEKAPRVRFVLSRIPFLDNPEEKLREQVLVEKIQREILSPYIKEVNVIHSDRELEEFERIKIGYKKDDGTAQISKDYLNLFEKLTENDLSTEEVKKFRNIKEAERIYVKAVEEPSLNKKLALIDEAIKYNPTHIEYLYYKSVTLSKLSKKDDAKQLLLDILNKNENYRQAYILLSNILIDQELYDQAIVQLNRFLSIFKDDPTGLYHLGLVYSRKESFEESTDILTRALSKNPSLTLALVARANNYRKTKNYELGLKDIYKAIQLNSESSVSFLILAMIQAELKRDDDFMLSLELALKYDKNNTIEKTIPQQSLFERFFKQDTFIKLLEKYNVSLPTSFWEKMKQK